MHCIVPATFCKSFIKQRKGIVRNMPSGFTKVEEEISKFTFGHAIFCQINWQIILYTVIL